MGIAWGQHQGTRLVGLYGEHIEQITQQSNKNRRHKQTDADDNRLANFIECFY